MNIVAATEQRPLGSAIVLALRIGLAALGVWAIGGCFWPEQFFRAYLVGWLFVWNLALGGLALVMIHHLTGGAWGIAVRRPLEAQMRTLPLVALLFLPIALGRKYIFPWSKLPLSAMDQAGFQASYFQPEFVWGRAVLYFALWTALAWLLSAWSRQEDMRGEASLAWKANGISGPGLVLYGISLHFASIDWMMSIEPSFTSTIYGPIVAASQLVSAFGLAIVVFAQTSDAGVFDGLVSDKVRRDLGNLLFTLIVTWAYLVWCQVMLIWIGDLKHDNIWWLARSRGTWPWIGGVLVLFQFIVPFFLLLFRAVKQNARWLGWIAALVLAMQFVFIHYQISPSFVERPPRGLWLDILPLLGLAGLWLAAFAWLLSRRPIAPLHDRNLPQARKLWLRDQVEAAREEAIANG